MIAKIYRNGAFSIPDNQYTKSFKYENFAWHSDQISYFKEIRKERGAATYPITRKTKNVFLSRCINLFERRQNSVMSQILTYVAEDSPENPYLDLNKYLSNLRKNYKLRNYVCALEKTKKNAWHYHLLLDMPFKKVVAFNSAWSSARGRCSPNSVRDVRKVRSEVGAAYYAAKYLSKDQSKAHDLKKFTYSRGVMGGEYEYIDTSVLKDLSVYYIKRVEYCTIGKVSISNDLKMIFNEKNDVSVL